MLSKSTEYALRALVLIYLENQKGNRPLLIEIAEEIDTPRAFTAKILQNLTRHSLLSSVKGRGGGFYFSTGMADTTLFTVIKLIEGERIFEKCGFGLNQCDSEKPCPLHDDYHHVREGFLRIAKEESIKTLAAKVEDGSAVLKRKSMSESIIGSKSWD